MNDLLKSDEVVSEQLCKTSLSQLSEAKAMALVHTLYSPQERFAEGIFRYQSDVLKKSGNDARASTLLELQASIKGFKANLNDPCVNAVGFSYDDEFQPVGIYAFRSLVDHPQGKKLAKVIHQQNNLKYCYSGSLAMAHSYSLLKEYRSLSMLKRVFVFIALDALTHDYQHIFFFMADHRLGKIYERFGLKFPEGLTFPDSKHLVGCFTLTPENIALVRDTSRTMEHQGLLRLT